MDATAGRADFLNHRDTYLTLRQVPIVTDFTASRERSVVTLPIIIMVIQCKSLKAVRTSRGDGAGAYTEVKVSLYTSSG